LRPGRGPLRPHQDSPASRLLAVRPRVLRLPVVYPPVGHQPVRRRQVVHPQVVRPQVVRRRVLRPRVVRPRVVRPLAESLVRHLRAPLHVRVLPARLLRAADHPAHRVQGLLCPEPAASSP